LFHKKVNKRVIPEYYETIKEPIALSIIKQKINTRAYQTIREFVRDFALIPFNAQVFNRPDSGAFQDALIVKGELEKQLQKLVESGVIKKEDSILPDLGEIPTYEDPPAEEVEDAGEDEEESDEEGEEDEDDDDDEGKKKRKGPRTVFRSERHSVTRIARRHGVDRPSS
jgi:chromatin structure-remodeling complex subunit RSC1/2